VQQGEGKEQNKNKKGKKKGKAKLNCVLHEPEPFFSLSI